MMIFHSYVKLPEGTNQFCCARFFPSTTPYLENGAREKEAVRTCWFPSHLPKKVHRRMVILHTMWASLDRYFRFQFNTRLARVLLGDTSTVRGIHLQLDGVLHTPTVTQLDATTFYEKYPIESGTHQNNVVHQNYHTVYPCIPLVISQANTTSDTLLITCPIQGIPYDHIK